MFRYLKRFLIDSYVYYGGACVQFSPDHTHCSGLDELGHKKLIERFISWILLILHLISHIKVDLLNKSFPFIYKTSTLYNNPLTVETIL
jgi:hypothetical protein